MAVYMIRQGERGPVKIGSTDKDVRQRLAQMQTGNHERLILLRLFEGGAEEEQHLHRMFADHRISGEWFGWTSAMLGDVGLAEKPFPLTRRQLLDAKFIAKSRAFDAAVLRGENPSWPYKGPLLPP